MRRLAILTAAVLSCALVAAAPAAAQETDRQMCEAGIACIISIVEEGVERRLIPRVEGEYVIEDYQDLLEMALEHPDSTNRCAVAMPKAIRATVSGLPDLADVPCYDNYRP